MEEGDHGGEYRADRVTLGAHRAWDNTERQS
jgi:hypothetical protein